MADGFVEMIIRLLLLSGISLINIPEGIGIPILSARTYTIASSIFISIFVTHHWKNPSFSLQGFIQ